MRGLLVFLLIFMWVPVMAFKPHVGVLVWSWVSTMNPHKQTYGFAHDFGFLNFTALATVLGLFLGGEKKRLPAHPILIMVVIYLIWVSVTTILAFEPVYSSEKYIQFAKSLVFVLVTVLVMQSPSRLKAFVMVLSLSMAYFGVKGGLFTLLTGGGARVQGGGGMLEDNNQLAMAMAMTVPLAFYFARHPPIPKLKLPLLGAAGLIMVAVLGTQSRGGFAALAAVMAMMLIKTRRKVAMVALLIPIAIGAYAFMPDSYRNRIKSSEHATEDSSFLGRVIMWKFSSNLADDRPIQGGGFNVFYVRRALELYLPPGHESRAPHSIYFEVLGEHGYTGLYLFLALLFTGYYSAGSTAKRLRRYKETVWIADLCSSIQLCIIGYAVGGLTVNIAIFEYYYNLLAAVVLCGIVGEKVLARDDGKGLTENTVQVDGEEKKPAKSEKWSPYG